MSFRFISYPMLKFSALCRPGSKNMSVNNSSGIIVRHVSRRSVKRPTTKAPSKPSMLKPIEDKDSWVEVVDKSTGQIYYWNQRTDETTALGAPRPTGPTAVSTYSEQQPSMMGGIGQAVAQGMAFGVGSGIGHGIIGSMFGGNHHNHHQSGGDDSYDI